MNGKARKRSIISNENGGVLALMAVALLGLLGMAALAVDLAMAFSARAEAQRAADSAALAGGSAFLDFEADLAEREGLAAARRWYRRQALASLPAFLTDTIYWSLAMLRNYLHVAIRTLIRHKGYTAINVSVVEITAKAISSLAAIAASSRDLPSSM